MYRVPPHNRTLTLGAQWGCAIFLQGTGDRFFPANTATARYHSTHHIPQTAFELAVKSGGWLQYRWSWSLAFLTVAAFNSTAKSEEYWDEGRQEEDLAKIRKAFHVCMRKVNFPQDQWKRLYTVSLERPTKQKDQDSVYVVHWLSSFSHFLLPDSSVSFIF